MKSRFLQLLSCLLVIVGLSGTIKAQSVDSLDVTFTVDLTVPELTGVFNPDSHLVRLVGGFNGWDVANGIGMAAIGDHQYSVSIRVDSSANPGSVEYKYLLDFNNGDIAWDEPSIDNGVNDNRSFVNDSAVDMNEDGIRDLFLDPEVFGIITPVAQIKNLPDGLFVQAEAVVTTPNLESASRTSFFMQQDGYGLNIFNYGTPARMVNAGDLIRVQGMIATYNGLKEVILDVPDNDIFTVDTGMPIPEPRLISYEEFVNAANVETDAANVQGTLVRLNGLITDPLTWPADSASNSVNVIAIADNDSTIAIRLLAQTEAIGVTPPANLDIIGVVGTYNGSQLHPRYASDIMGTIQPLPIPVPPYALGDTINYNGSFANFDLGSKGEASGGWFFDTFNGASTYEIVDDAQDGDGKALKVGVVYNDSPDIWRVQVINEPINVSSGDYYVATFWAKASDTNRKVHAYLGLPEAGFYDEVASYDFNLTTDWVEYSISYLVKDFDAEVGMRFGFSMNYAENADASIFIDNLQITKQEPYFTDITFSVNVSPQITLGNFNPDSNSVALVGWFNEWDTSDPVFLSTNDDSVYSGTLNETTVALMDTLEYKFILLENSTGNFEWEANDPGTENTRGEFQNRFLVANNLDEITVPTVYFHGIEPEDLSIANHEIISIAEARLTPQSTHIAVQGIVTRATRNFVYLEDETGGTMIFSRDWFGEFLSLGFNEAIANNEIEVGDELKVAGISWDYYGLHETTRIHAWEVVSTDNPLPGPQSITIADYSSFGEAYESELVRLENIRIDGTTDSLYGGTLYPVTDELGNVGWMSIPGSSNSEWANKPAPQDLFNFEGVVKEYYLPDSDYHFYAITPHYYSDIEINSEYFNAAFELTSLSGLVGNTFAYPIELTEIGGDAIEGFRFKLMFDPSIVSVTVDDDQSGTLVDGINLEVNNETSGEIYIGGIAMDGISTTGTLINLTVELLAGGYTDVYMSEVEINEQGIAIEPWGAVNVVLRLCGDVTGDETVSSLDAVAALRHSVRLAPEFPLTGLDSTAADVTGNGVITPYDGAKILHYEVGIIDHLACIDLPLKGEPEVAKANWFLDSYDAEESVVRVNFTDSEFEVYSVQFVLDMSEGISLNGVSNLPDNWNVMQNLSDGKMIVSAYGVSPIEEKSLELTFETKSASGLPKISGDIILNESNAPELEELVIGEVPTELVLGQNYPNPFNPTTNISYSLPDMAKVELSIYNMLGQKVATLVNTTQDVGNYTVTWKAGSLSSGVYIYRLSVDNQVFTKRMMLVK